MSTALNFISTSTQGYGPSETSLLPCFGVARRAVSRVKIITVKRSLKHASFVCKAGGTGGQRRNPDFPKQNRHIFSRNRNRYNEERDNNPENLDESEFVSTKNGPILSISNSPRANATATPGPKEKEIVELFRKVQAQLRERAAGKEEKKFEGVKSQNKENESVDSLLQLLRKHSAEQGKRKVNGGNSNEFNVDRPRQSGKPNADITRSYTSPSPSPSPSPSIAVKEEPEETVKPSFVRPVSNFRRRSPVPRVKYEPVVSTEDTYDSVSHSDLDVNTNGAHYEPVPDYESESESDLETVLDIASGLELDREEELDDEPEIELEPETEFTGKQQEEELEDEISDSEEDVYDEKDTVKQHTEIKDMSVMKVSELRDLAKARGMKGYSKLKKSELIGLLSDDSSAP